MSFSTTEHAHQQWVIRPNEESVHELTVALMHNDVVYVQGPYGAGKSAHSLEASRRFVRAQHAYVIVGPNSQLSSTELAQALVADVERPAIVVLDKPHRLPQQLLDTVCKGVSSKRFKLVVESIDASVLPSSLINLKSLVPTTTVSVAELALDEFHSALEDYLDGAIPAELVRYFWNATGGNQELASHLISGLRASGELKLGKYAWYWSGPLVVPVQVLAHVRRQFELLTQEQREFLERLSLVGSLPLPAVSSLISDDALASLRHGGFVRTHQLVAGAKAVKLSAWVVGRVAARNVQPSRRTEIFQSTAIPTRAQIDPIATVAWMELAIDESVDVSAELVAFANECAFPIFRWEMIERFVDLKVPANKMEHHIVRSMATLSAEERGFHILMIAQRGLASYFLDRPDRAQADARLARKILELDHEGQEDRSLQLAQLERNILRALPNAQALKAHLSQASKDARDRGDDFLAESYRVQGLSVANEDVLDRVSVDELFAEATADLGQYPFAVSLTPVAIARCALAGQFARAERLIERTIDLRELRITFLPEHSHTFSFAELAAKAGYAYIMMGKSELGLRIIEDPMASTILDPPTVQTVRGFAFVAQGKWDKAIHQFRGALQRYEERDHIHTRKISLAGYMQALVGAGKHSEAVAVLRDFDQTQLCSCAIYESELEYRALQVRYALREPDFEERLRAYLKRFADSGDWYGCVQAAHLGVAVGTDRLQDEMFDVLVAACEHIDQEIAAPFLLDARAVLDRDEPRLAVARAALARLGIRIPKRSAQLKLTKRQREIADLVALGLSNKDIAERLFLSVRTVESHVAAVLEKVGSTDRRTLAAKLAAI